MIDYKIDETNIHKAIESAIIDDNETLLHDLIIKAMKLYLDNKLDINDLESLAISHITVPIRLKLDNSYYKFKNKKLDYVFVELSAITQIDTERIKEVLQRFIAYLENEETAY
jgi:hypothetical protein